MSEGRRNGWFVRFINRIRGRGPLSDEDRQSVSRMPIDPPAVRVEQPIDRGGELFDHLNRFVTSGFIGYDSMAEGLAKTGTGWEIIDDFEAPEIAGGGFADIELAYSIRDKGKPLERRHLCVLKVQNMNNIQAVWNEVNVLRGVIHENIIDFYGVFADRSSQMMYILLEYANAGNLEHEIDRYPGRFIPETGTRYYLLQVCEGLRYLHSKEIRHHDLHTGNVLLKYNRDNTKKIILADFGVSVVFDSSWYGNSKRFSSDVDSV